MEDNEIILKSECGNITYRDIKNYLTLVCERYNLDINDIRDNTKCNSSLFNQCILRDIGKALFKDSNILKHKVITPTNITYKYNKEMILRLCELYISLCNEYDKRIYINGFYNFVNINYDDSDTSLYDGLNVLHHHLAKRLDEADNLQQGDKARDSKQAILNLAYNNYRHGWNGTIRGNEIKGTVKTLEDIRQNTSRITTSDSTKQRPTIE